jgi:sec-independent protein translocase protein TatC
MSSLLSIFIVALVVITIIGPQKLPQSVEQLWLMIENLRRQQNNLKPLTLSEARKIWRASGSPIYAIVGGLYQGAEHLSELRKRLMTTAIAFFVAAFACLFFASYIFAFLKAPAGNIDLIFTKPAENMLMYFKVVLVAGAAVAMPLLLYQILMFVYPAMESSNERRSFKIFAALAVPFAFLFFVGGFCFAYFVMLPFALKYLFSFGSQIARPLWAITEYINFVLAILFWIGIVFELPLVMLVLARLGIVSASQIASKRKYALVVIALIAAVITPTPDPFNMLIVAAPLYLLFELGILLARLVRSPKRAVKKAES